MARVGSFPRAAVDAASQARAMARRAFLVIGGIGALTLGLAAFGIRSAGIGIAIKIADGNSRGMHTVTYNVLDQLGLLDDARRTVLERFRRPEIRNARGTLAGDMRPLFTLQRA